MEIIQHFLHTDGVRRRHLSAENDPAQMRVGCRVHLGCKRGKRLGQDRLKAIVAECTVFVGAEPGCIRQFIDAIRHPALHGSGCRGGRGIPDVFRQHLCQSLKPWRFLRFSIGCIRLEERFQGDPVRNPCFQQSAALLKGKHSLGRSFSILTVCFNRLIFQFLQPHLESQDGFPAVPLLKHDNSLKNIRQMICALLCTNRCKAQKHQG